MFLTFFKRGIRNLHTNHTAGFTLQSHKTTIPVLFGSKQETYSATNKTGITVINRIDYGYDFKEEFQKCFAIIAKKVGATYLKPTRFKLFINTY